METGNKEKKKKLVEIWIHGTEKCLEPLDENDEGTMSYSGILLDDYLVFIVDENEYSIDDFGDEIYGCDPKLVDIKDFNVAEFFESEEAYRGMLYTNKAGWRFNIEIDEDEEFDLQKAYLFCRDFIYPDGTEEPMLAAFVYNDVPYTDFFFDSSRGIAGEQIWPISDDDDDGCNDEVDEDDE